MQLLETNITRCRNSNSIRGSASDVQVESSFSNSESFDGSPPGGTCPEAERQNQKGGSARIALAIDKLKSLHDGYRGVTEVVACGKKAIPALRALLFEREPSGLFQPRCLAVEALAGLNAYEVLIDYLNKYRKIVDPVECLGEDAVISAAACALGGLREERVFNLLMSLAERQLQPGVIRALGAFGWPEAIPYLIAALAEDESRPMAEAALRSFGASARRALIVAATGGASPSESESSLRRRRSALWLLIEIGVPAEMWTVLRQLVQDRDAKIAMLACKIALVSAPQLEKPEVIRRLIGLLPHVDWMSGEEIELCLVENFEIAREFITTILQRGNPLSDGPSAESPALRTLLRVKARSEAPSKSESWLARVRDQATSRNIPALLIRSPATIKATGQ